MSSNTDETMILYKRSTIILLANPNCPACGDKANSILRSCTRGMQGSQESTTNNVQKNKAASEALDRRERHSEEK